MFFTLLFQQTLAQTPEQRFVKATKQEQVQIAMQIAQNNKTSDPTKAATWAQKAYDVAKELSNQGAMAQAAFVNAEAFMSAKAVGKAKPKFERAAAHAEAIGDFAMVSDCYTQLINLASRENNSKESLRLGQIAASLLKKKGGGGNAAQSSVPDNRYQQLAEENKALNREISNLRQQLAGNKQGEKAKIADAQRQLEKLEKVRQEAEQQSKQLESQISTMSAEKAKAVLLAENAKRQQEKLEAQKKSIEAQQEKEIAEKEAELKTAELAAEQSKNLRNILLVGLIGLVGILILVFNRFKANQKAKKVLEEKSRMIEKEQQRSEELLLNILPPSIAEELKREGRAKARSIPEASVLFTDFKNFTQIAEQLTPEQLVAELDYCFKGFDYIISQYNIEKIKTIGDAYMCASGLTANSGTPIKLVQAAMEMQDFLRDYREEKIALGQPYFEARIGIHTGPVVAGVVGNKKFAYDIWGDTVNLAARMEQNGEPNRVNISESTYWKVKYDFDCEFRGKLNVKNKGDVEMYFVKGKLQLS